MAYRGERKRKERQEDMRKVFRSLISLEEARSILLCHAPKIEVETVPLRQALGCVLAEKIVSGIDVPGFDRASMDGYAVRASDTLDAREDRPVRLGLAGSVPVGSLAGLEVGNLKAAEVSTGSVMPEGADAVVMIEHSEPGTGLGEVLVMKPVYAGENVLYAGSDIMFGDAVLLPGTRLAPKDIGVLAAIGLDSVKIRALRVGIASTGNELVRPRPDEKLQPGQIYDINSFSIAATAQECGATPIEYGILSDDRAAISGVLTKMAEECSMIIVSGSTSAGAGDMIYEVLDDLGETIFHGINLKPGKPTIFGTISDKPILGLPGYPTSALTVFGQLAAPAIRKALGLMAFGHKLEGKLARPVRTDGRHQLLAVGVHDGLVYSVDKGSGSITTLSEADGVIEIPSSIEYLDQGSKVEVQLFQEHIEPDLVVAGENCPLMEMIAESLPLQFKNMGGGTRKGIFYALDGIADLAVVSLLDQIRIPDGLVQIFSYTRELGLISRDPGVLDQEKPEIRSIVGWSKDSEMAWRLDRALGELGVDPLGIRQVGRARTHSAVAAAVACDRAQAGFGARMAAEKAGLGFRLLSSDRIGLLAAPSSLEREGVRALISYLGSEEMRRSRCWVGHKKLKREP